MNENFWNGKKVLITGHTGFKGSWLSLWLQKMGAEIIGLSIDAGDPKGIYALSNLSKSMVDWRGDIGNIDTVKRIFHKNKIDIVFHLAAQPLVSEGYKKPVETYNSNVMGTLNLLEALAEYEGKVAGVFITTDKVYENKESLWGYREIDPLGGYDPYSSSKACCEILINSYRQSYFNPQKYSSHKKSIASARAGNVIGGGDWADNRIIPDLIKAYENNSEMNIRHPQSIRPWQHVLEALSGYILLAEKLYENPLNYCEPWNFGPNTNHLYTVKEIADKINTFTENEIKINYEIQEDFHETTTLSLDITKSRVKLGWKPKLNFHETIKLTMDWYLNYKKVNVQDLCKSEIDYFIKHIEI